MSNEMLTEDIYVRALKVYPLHSSPERVWLGKELMWNVLGTTSSRTADSLIRDGVGKQDEPIEEIRIENEFERADNIHNWGKQDEAARDPSTLN